MGSSSKPINIIDYQIEQKDKNWRENQKI